MAKKITDFPIDQTGKADKYHERINNKRYRERKQRIHEKLAGITSDIISGETWDSLNLPNNHKKDGKLGIVSGFKYSLEGKIIEILELTSGENLESIVDKKLPHILESDLAIGDKVIFIKKDGTYTIVNREKRENFLARLRVDADRPTLTKSERQIIATNLDYAVIVAAAKNPDFHPNLIDRYLILCQNGGVKPLICITKCDLLEPTHPILSWYEKELGAKVILTSTYSGLGLDKLKETLLGKTCVLVGNSGVGKSTITNALLDANVEKIGDVGEKTGQGRHTTTASHVYSWSKDSFIIDTPGIRSLEIFEIPQNELKLYFEEFNLVIPRRLASRISPSGYLESLKTRRFSIAFEKCKEIDRICLGVKQNIQEKVIIYR